MIYRLITTTAFIATLLSSCVSSTQLSNLQSEKKRLETLLEKERTDNDQLNTQRSIYESQIQALQTSNNKTIAETAATIDNLKQQIVKLNADAKQKDDKYKALEASFNQEKERNQAEMQALDEKIDDLAEDKKELQQEKYQMRKAAVKKKSTRRRRRR